MRKLTECLIVAAFLLCAFTAQAESGIDVSVPSAGEPCSNDLDCGPGELCVNDICSAARPCSNDLQCDPGERCIDDVCQESGCETSEDCEEGLVCDNTTGACVECLTTADCEEGLVCDNNTSFTCVECFTWKDCDNQTEICSDNNTCVQADDCDLKITPKRVKINRNSKVDFKVFKLTVKGNENFYPFRIDPVTGEPVINPVSGKPFRDMTLDPFGIRATTYRWRQKNRMLEEVLGLDNDVDSGFYTLRFGNCLVDIEVQNKADAKKK